MTDIQKDFAAVTSINIGDQVFVLRKSDAGLFELRNDVVESVQYIHGPLDEGNRNPVYAGTTRGGHTFALIDQTGEIVVRAHALWQVFRDADKIQKFLDIEKTKIEDAHQARMDSINAISLGLHKA